MTAHSTKTLTIALAAAFLAAGCAQPEKETPAQSVSTASSGPAAAVALKSTATVTKVNRKTREVTLKRADESLVTIVAGEEVRNFNQIKVGDIVETEVIEALAVVLEPAHTQVRERRESVAGSRAALGEKPGMKTTRTVEITAQVVAIDAKKREVTVRGAVQTVVLEAGEGIDLSPIKVGDNVRAVYIESLSIQVRSPSR
jgi:bifunctional DNA-binding transcriptional regulator/antitoxin component of YhaV-PrlF toxin-antitoxin module